MCGRFAKDVARGLRIRCDWGPQYIADAWINEVKWLGMTITPSYVGEPECNGVIERFMRTLKQEEVDGSAYRDVADARAQVGSFIETYNRQRLHSALDYLSPEEYEATLPCSGQGRAPVLNTPINEICHPV